MVTNTIAGGHFSTTATLVATFAITTTTRKMLGLLAAISIIIDPSVDRDVRHLLFLVLQPISRQENARGTKD